MVWLKPVNADISQDPEEDAQTATCADVLVFARSEEHSQTQTDTLCISPSSNSLPRPISTPVVSVQRLSVDSLRKLFLLDTVSLL